MAPRGITHSSKQSTENTLQLSLQFKGGVVRLIFYAGDRY